MLGRQQLAADSRLLVSAECSKQPAAVAGYQQHVLLPE